MFHFVTTVTQKIYLLTFNKNYPITHADSGQYITTQASFWWLWLIFFLIVWKPCSKLKKSCVSHTKCLNNELEIILR